MKNFLKITSCFSFLVLTGCASTHGQFITDKHDAWIDGSSSEGGSADKGLLFCRANVKEDGLADPICFESRFEEYEDEKPRVETEKKASERSKTEKDKSEKKE